VEARTPGMVLRWGRVRREGAAGHGWQWWGVAARGGAQAWLSATMGNRGNWGRGGTMGKLLPLLPCARTKKMWREKMAWGKGARMARWGSPRPGGGRAPGGGEGGHRRVHGEGLLGARLLPMGLPARALEGAVAAKGEAGAAAGEGRVGAAGVEARAPGRALRVGAADAEERRGRRGRGLGRARLTAAGRAPRPRRHLARAARPCRGRVPAQWSHPRQSGALGGAALSSLGHARAVAAPG
jgi:hypothetical protein